MENFSASGITLSTILDTRRVKDDLTFPVKYRVTYKRKQVYYPSGIDLPEEEWRCIEKTKKRELIGLREIIQAGFDRIKGHIKGMILGEGFSFETLNNKLLRGMQNSLISEFYTKIERLENEGRVTTASSYRCAIKSIQKYTKADLKITDITVDWLKRYEKHLLEEDRSITTVGMYMRALRAIINDCKTLISPSQYPFGRGKYEIKKGAGRKMALTLQQIKSVLKYPLFTDADKMYRDLWYFSFLCNGININDLLRLRYSSIVNGEVFFLRGKTRRTINEQKEIRATLLPEMQTIIDKWGNAEKKRENYIFPFFRDGLTPTEHRKIVQNVTWLINKRMKMIGESLKLGNITCYSARHSYATILKHNNVNIAYISESLGHADLKTTENYLASFDQEERARNAALLTKF